MQVNKFNTILLFIIFLMPLYNQNMGDVNLNDNNINNNIKIYSAQIP